MVNINRTALIVVDMQNDFITGSLAVPLAELIIPQVNELIRYAEIFASPTIFTMDWHAPDHPSFTSFGGTWPSHCVVNTIGASLYPGLYKPEQNTHIIKKGLNKESYSAFDKENMRLFKVLEYEEIDNVIICGLALDYCVKATAIDAVDLGFNTSVAEFATAAVDNDSRSVMGHKLDLMRKGVKILYE